MGSRLSVFVIKRLDIDALRSHNYAFTQRYIYASVYPDIWVLGASALNITSVLSGLPPSLKPPPRWTSLLAVTPSSLDPPPWFDLSLPPPLVLTGCSSFPSHSPCTAPPRYLLSSEDPLYSRSYSPPTSRCRDLLSSVSNSNCKQ